MLTRHLGQIRNGHLAGDVPAQGDRQRTFGLLELRGVDDLPNRDGADHLVGHLDADGGLVGDGGLDAHAGGGEV